MPAIVKWTTRGDAALACERQGYFDRDLPVTAFPEEILLRTDAERGKPDADHPLGDLGEPFLSGRGRFRCHAHIVQEFVNRSDDLQASDIPWWPLERLFSEEVRTEPVHDREQDAVGES